MRRPRPLRVSSSLPVPASVLPAVRKSAERLRIRFPWPGQMDCSRSGTDRPARTGCRPCIPCCLPDKTRSTGSFLRSAAAMLHNLPARKLRPLFQALQSLPRYPPGHPHPVHSRKPPRSVRPPDPDQHQLHTGPGRSLSPDSLSPDLPRSYPTHQALRSWMHLQTVPGPHPFLLQPHCLQQGSLQLQYRQIQHIQSEDRVK